MTTKEFKEMLEIKRDKFLAALRETGVRISDVVDVLGYTLEFRTTHNVFDYDINCGGCEDFANEVVEQCPEAEAIWLDELHEENEGTSHCVIRFKNRFYDAECIEGVRSWRKIPSLLNDGKKRLSVMIERGITPTEADRDATVDQSRKRF